MDLKFLLLADYANVTVDQKLNVMGMFSTLRASGFPTTHPEMYLIFGLAASPAEYGRAFKLGVKLINEDASHAPVDLTLDSTVPIPAPRGGTVTMQPIIRLTNIVFPAPGSYQFSILINDDEKGTLPLDVMHVEQQAPG